MTYTITNHTKSLIVVMQTANDYTLGLLGIFIILITFLITFIGLKQYTSERAFAPAVFLASLAGLILRLLEMVDDYVTFICAIALVVSMIWLSKKDYG